MFNTFQTGQRSEQLWALCRSNPRCSSTFHRGQASNLCGQPHFIFSHPTCVGAGRLLVKNRCSVSVGRIDARYAVVDESQPGMSHCRSFCERLKHWHGHGHLKINTCVNSDKQSLKLIQTVGCSSMKYREVGVGISDSNIHDHSRCVVVRGITSHYC